MKHQSGRSMVEILGVLAIIGVLSVGGLAAYNYAMDKKVVNDLMYDMELATTEIWTSGTTGSGDLGKEIDVSVLGENHPNIRVRKLQHMENGEIVLYERDGKITEEDVAAVENGQEPAFSIEIHDITVAQCVQLLRNQDKLNTPFPLEDSDGTPFEPEKGDDPQDFCERIFGKNDPVAFGLISNAYAEEGTASLVIKYLAAPLLAIEADVTKWCVSSGGFMYDGICCDGPLQYFRGDKTPHISEACCDRSDSYLYKNGVACILMDGADGGGYMYRNGKIVIDYSKECCPESAQGIDGTGNVVCCEKENGRFTGYERGIYWLDKHLGRREHKYNVACCLGEGKKASRSACCAVREDGLMTGVDIFGNIQRESCCFDDNSSGVCCDTSINVVENNRCCKKELDGTLARGGRDKACCSPTLEGKGEGVCCYAEGFASSPFNNTTCCRGDFAGITSNGDYSEACCDGITKYDSLKAEELRSELPNDMMVEDILHLRELYVCCGKDANGLTKEGEEAPICCGSANASEYCCRLDGGLWEDNRCLECKTDSDCKADQFCFNRAKIKEWNHTLTDENLKKLARYGLELNTCQSKDQEERACAPKGMYGCRTELGGIYPYLVCSREWYHNCPGGTYQPSDSDCPTSSQACLQCPKDKPYSIAGAESISDCFWCPDNAVAFTEYGGDGDRSSIPENRQLSDGKCYCTENFVAVNNGTACAEPSCPEETLPYDASNKKAGDKFNVFHPDDTINPLLQCMCPEDAPVAKYEGVSLGEDSPCQACSSGVYVSGYGCVNDYCEKTEEYATTEPSCQEWGKVCDRENGSVYVNDTCYLKTSYCAKPEEYATEDTCQEWGKVCIEDGSGATFIGSTCVGTSNMCRNMSTYATTPNSCTVWGDVCDQSTCWIGKCVDASSICETANSKTTKDECENLNECGCNVVWFKMEGFEGSCYPSSNSPCLEAHKWNFARDETSCPLWGSACGYSVKWEDECIVTGKASDDGSAV